ncbi:cucumisin-like [Cryptomeria japonica]|uniref:cucumisin-like n=1 Tax=Cryptomeria japonica TaxID=3369 RepID=UPI0027D9F965|nr:cucumisin-like [Cryptomeria japonica]
MYRTKVPRHYPDSAILELKLTERIVETAKSPIASIAKSVATNDLPAPIVASFSSKEPNPITPDHLKPDITAPGVDILGAWSNAAPEQLPMLSSTLDATLDGNEAAELGYGAGQINPFKAINLGLVYDTNVDSYINMLCSQGYNETFLRLLTGEFIVCSSNLSNNGVWELNYPSIMVIGNVSEPFLAQFLRTVTNVGPAKST